MHAIEIKNITKRFGKTIALNNINLEIEKNEIFGLLGPNGAGKTTLINILATLVLPTSGSVNIMGYDVVKQPIHVRKIIGYSMGYASFFEYLTGMENIKFYARLYGVEVDHSLINLLGMRNKINVKVSEYSNGMLQRLGLIVASIHRPKVLLLDEPTIGLDPNIAISVRRYIKKLKSRQTIFLTTHNMYEAEDVCDRVAIINKGIIIALGTPEELKKGYRAKTLEEVFLKLTKMRLEV